MQLARCGIVVVSGLWRPLDDLTFEEALERITPTVKERNPSVWEVDADGKQVLGGSVVITPEHLVSDYAVSRNIARFGLKVTTLNGLWKDLGLEDAGFFHHEYTVSVEKKIEHVRQTIEKWRL